MLNATMLLAGVVLVAMVLAEPQVRRLPISPALVYLVVGWVAASFGGLLPSVESREHAPFLLHLSEWAVLVSLFAIGLRVRSPQRLSAWRVPILLASSGMLVTIALCAVAAHLLLDLGWAAAVLLGAILAPTDPVLASDVQIRSARDRDAARMSLTIEGALNDGTAFPIVALALGWLDLQALGTFGIDWLLKDLLWAIGGGIAVGWAVGRGLGWALNSRLAREHPLAWDELLYVGAIALTTSAAALLHASTFLAVFVAGTAMFREPPWAPVVADTPTGGGPGLPSRLVAFGERCERLVEVAMVLVIGALLTWVSWSVAYVAFGLAVLFIVRPASVLAVVRAKAMPPAQRRLVAWFGIRGVGSLFYLMVALQGGVAGLLARELISACLICIALSIFLHGVSATPVMNWYRRRRARADERPASRDGLP